MLKNLPKLLAYLLAIIPKPMNDFLEPKILIFVINPIVDGVTASEWTYGRFLLGRVIPHFVTRLAEEMVSKEGGGVAADILFCHCYIGILNLCRV